MLSTSSFGEYGAVQVVENVSLSVSIDSVDSLGTAELIPRLWISKGSLWYWNANLLRGETCQVI